MVLQLALAGLGAAGSIFSGISGRNAAKKTQKLQIEAANFANAYNRDQVKAYNAKGLKASKELAATPEITTQSTSTESSVNIEGMMKAAEAAGINPITFIRNGGLQAYAKNSGWDVTTRSGHNAVAAAQLRMGTMHQISATPISHVPGAGEAVGQGISQFAGAAGNYFNQQSAQAFTADQAQLQRDFQREMLMAQLGGVQQGGSIPGGRSFYVPGFSTAGPTVTRQTQGGLAGIGTPTAPTAGDREVTNPYPVGSGINVDPRWVNAEQAESRYGDILQELFGVATFGADVWKNVSGYLATSPTWRGIKDTVKDLGLSVQYDPNKKPEVPLRFTVKPKGS
ncbi:hypothetical protein [Tortoise microvirus 82]|nr:hypothetical protein [Tortoise microvirus 82]